MKLNNFKWLTQVNKAIKLDVIHPILKLLWLIALGFLIRTGSNKTIPNLSSLPQKAFFITLAYMAHMVWQGVLLQGTLADAASLPWSCAICNLMSAQLLKQRKRALKGLLPAINYFTICPHKPLCRNSHMVKSLSLQLSPKQWGIGCQ